MHMIVYIYIDMCIYTYIHTDFHTHINLCVYLCAYPFLVKGSTYGEHCILNESSPALPQLRRVCIEGRLGADTRGPWRGSLVPNAHVCQGYGRYGSTFQSGVTMFFC